MIIEVPHTFRDGSKATAMVRRAEATGDIMWLSLTWHQRMTSADLARVQNEFQLWKRSVLLGAVEEKP